MVFAINHRRPIESIGMEESTVAPQVDRSSEGAGSADNLPFAVKAFDNLGQLLKEVRALIDPRLLTPLLRRRVPAGLAKDHGDGHRGARRGSELNTLDSLHGVLRS